ncbi:MAG TPA: NAD(P)-dependent oxidoreductase [Nitrosopumilaceae archaeon]|nr:NAD(P)-dependent oxidoreductase [Nitrosopumilaceae archaeon]
MKKKLLIFGISGLTGYKVAKSAISKYDVYGTYNIRSTTIENCVISKLDLTDKNEVNKLFTEIKPDVVVNTTALHNVDYCEENKEQASKVNTEVVRTLYENSEKFDSKLIHISTDYVFDGNKNSSYRESDKAIPVSFYGQSKLDGEKILEKSQHVVLRPSVVYGWTTLELAGITSSSGKPMNFALWILTRLHKNEQLKIVTDQFASATLADSLAESALIIGSTNKSGLYHVSGLSCESRYDFAVKLAKKFGYDASVISSVTSSGFVQKAKRPAYSCLDCQKAIKEFGLKLLTTDDALNIMKIQVEKEAPHLINN